MQFSFQKDKKNINRFFEKIKKKDETLYNIFCNLAKQYDIIVEKNTILYFTNISDYTKKQLSMPYMAENNLALITPDQDAVKIQFSASSQNIYIKFLKIKSINIQQDEITYLKLNDFYIYVSGYNILKHKYNKIFYPVRIKDILYSSNKIHSEFFKIYLQEMSKNNNLIKDIYNDYCQSKISLYVPIKLSDFENKTSKVHLFDSLKYNTYKCFNKFSLDYTYSLLKSLKYIGKNNLSVFLEEDFYKTHQLHSFFNEKERIQRFLIYFYLYKKKITFEDYHWELDDYILLVMQNNLQVNLNCKTSSQILKEHDKIINQLIEKEKKVSNRRVLPKNSIFLQFKFPNNFIPLITEKDFYLEGKKQHNCVETRKDIVKNGQAIIFSFIFKNKHYTLDLRLNQKNNLYIYECKGFANKEIDQETKTYLQQILHQIQ